MAAVFAMSCRGATVMQISQAIGCTRERVRVYRSRLGLGHNRGELATLSPSDLLRLARSHDRLDLPQQIPLARSAAVGLRRELAECESLLTELGLLASAARLTAEDGPTGPEDAARATNGLDHDPDHLPEAPEASEAP